ncbi:MAG: Hpt domain-containing protein [Lachnospiraceae bacterium]
MDIQQLEAIGIDYEEGIQRFAGKANLYEKYLVKFLEDTNFYGLEQALKVKDYEQAYMYAHTLKGVAGNLSMNTFHQSLITFVDYLRHHNLEAIEEEFPNIQQQYQKITEALI